MEVDWIYRLYTVLNFSPEEMKEIKKYGYQFMDEQIGKEIKKISEYFIKIGLTELIKIEDIRQIHESSTLIVFKYKFLNTKKIFYFKLLFGLILLASISLLILM